MNRITSLVLASAASWGMALAAGAALAADGPTRACTALASRVATATGGKLDVVEGDGYNIVVPGARSAYYGCAEGAEGLTVDGLGRGLSARLAKAITAAATVIAGHQDPAFRQSASACVKGAVFIPDHGKAGGLTARPVRRRLNGKVTAGGLQFLCILFTDGSEPPVFFVGPRPTAR